MKGPSSLTAPTPNDIETASNKDHSHGNSSTITIRSPRQYRAIKALKAGKVRREGMDRITHSSNSPEIIRQLRTKGLAIECDQITVTDYDGEPSRPGIYWLQPSSFQLADELIDSFEIYQAGRQEKKREIHR